MNRYGDAAMRHWRRWLPRRFETIANPQEFFSNLGERVAEEVELLADHLAGPDRPGEGYLGKVGRLETAKARAEERILAELVFLPPEAGVDPDEDEQGEPSLAVQMGRLDQELLDEAIEEHERELDTDHRPPPPTTPSVGPVHDSDRTV